MSNSVQSKYSVIIHRHCKAHTFLSWAVPVVCGVIVGLISYDTIQGLLLAVTVAAIVALLVTPLILFVVDEYYFHKLILLTEQIPEEMSDEPRHIRDACMDSIVND